MNAKRCKKLRWYARAQEVLMPAPVVNEKGISSLLLVYPHRKVFKDPEGVEHEFFNHTIQYNPRTSGKGFYKALKGKRARVQGKLPFVRYMCQRRIIEVLSARQQRDAAVDAVQGNPDTAKL
jgi:hypothetical protein